MLLECAVSETPIEFSAQIVHPANPGPRSPFDYDLNIIRLIIRHTVIDNNGCWNWTRCKTNGYGYMSYYGTAKRLNRLVLHLTGRMHLDEKLHALHHCDNRACVNPDHLYTGTNYENVQDCKRRNRVSRNEAHPATRLDNATVERLREDYRNGLSSYALGRKYGIHNTYAWRLATRKRRSL